MQESGILTKEGVIKLSPHMDYGFSTTNPWSVGRNKDKIGKSCLMIPIFRKAEIFDFVLQQKFRRLK